MITTPTVSGKPGQAPTGLSCDLHPLIGSHSTWTDPRGPAAALEQLLGQLVADAEVVGDHGVSGGIDAVPVHQHEQQPASRICSTCRRRPHPRRGTMPVAFVSIA